MQMDRMQIVMDTARQFGAETVRRDAGVVHVSFRKLDRGHREIGFLEARVDDRVRLLDYRQSSCLTGRRFGAAVSRWVARATEALQDANVQPAQLPTASCAPADCAILPN